MSDDVFTFDEGPHVLEFSRPTRGGDDRTSPHNIEAERSVLGAILLHNEVLPIAAALITPTDFFRDAHRRIFVAMTALTAIGTPIDLVTLNEELGRMGALDEVGGPAYITALVDGVPRSTNVESYARIIKEKASLRAAIFVANKALAAAYAGQDDASTVVAQALDSFTTLGGQRLDAPMFDVINDVDILQRPTPPFLIDQVMTEASRIVLYGPSGKLKTFTKVSLELSIATGRTWFGAGVPTSGSVVAFNPEGFGRYKFRVAAWKIEAGLPLDRAVKYFTIGEAFSLMDRETVRRVIAALREYRPLLVSFDPLIRFMPGGDDSKSADIARVTDNLDLIQHELNAATFVVHHTGWDESRERGSSALRSSADTVLSQSYDDEIVTLKCEKQKDWEEFSPIRFRRAVVPVPTLDGTSFVLRLATDQIDVRAPELTPKHCEAIEVLRRTFPGGARHSQWLKALPKGFEERTLYRAEHALVIAGLLRREGKRGAIFVPIGGT